MHGKRRFFSFTLRDKRKFVQMFWVLIYAVFASESDNDPVTQTSEEAEKQAEMWHSNNFMYNYPMYTVLVPSGKIDCYFHTTHDSIHFDYMVEKGGSLDIDFAAYNAETEELIFKRNFVLNLPTKCFFEKL